MTIKFIHQALTTESKGVHPTMNTQKEQNALKGRSMAKNELLSFEERLAKREAEKELERDLIRVKKLLAIAYPYEKAEMLEALNAREKERYMSIVEPIIKRMVIREYNGEGRVEK